MFSGIIEEAAVLKRVEGSSSLKRLSIESKLDHSKTKIGDSIAIDGVCLTVTKIEGAVLTFDASSETLRRSSLLHAKPGDRLNLERSLSLGDRIHGHIVSGHVDSVITLISRRKDGDCERLEWRFDPQYRKFIAAKGSIAVAGISLTVGEVSHDTFSLYIIPHTMAVTTLATMQVGHKANMEVDLLARYVQSNLEKKS